MGGRGAGTGDRGGFRMRAEKVACVEISLTVKIS